MYFDRNINGKKDDKFLDCDYCVCVTLGENYFSTNSGILARTMRYNNSKHKSQVLITIN